MKKPGRGEFNWQIEQQDGSIVNHEEDDGTVNSFHHRGSDGTLKRLDHAKIKHLRLIDCDGNVAATFNNVPAGAKIFSFRRGPCPINYQGRWKEVKTKTEDEIVNGKVIEGHEITKRFPYMDYDHVNIIGYRFLKQNGEVETRVKAVYFSNNLGLKVDEHVKWGEKPWLYEPLYFSECCLDDEDLEIQADRWRQANPDVKSKTNNGVQKPKEEWLAELRAERDEA